MLVEAPWGQRQGGVNISQPTKTKGPLLHEFKSAVVGISDHTIQAPTCGNGEDLPVIY